MVLLNDTYFNFIYVFPGLGSDSKLPFHIRLLSASSKQIPVRVPPKSNFPAALPPNHSHNGGGGAGGRHSTTSFQTALSGSGGHLPSIPPAVVQPLNLSDYMRMDKSSSINKVVKSNGFSIDEIMKP